MKVHRKIRKKTALVKPIVDSKTSNLSNRFFELGGGADPLNPYGEDPWDVTANKNTPIPALNYGQQYPQPNMFSNAKPDFSAGQIPAIHDVTKGNTIPVDSGMSSFLAGEQEFSAVLDAENLYNSANADEKWLNNKGITKTKTTEQKFDEEVNKNYYGEDSRPTKEGIKDEQPFQFFNPYAGADLASSAHLLGQTFQNEGSTKNTLTGIAAGANVLTKLARPMVAGMGYAKANAEALKEKREKDRSGMIGSYDMMAAEGGEVPSDGEFKFGFEDGMEEENEEFIPELLTGDYSTGSKQAPANAEVEKNEYLKTPDGNVTKVVGEPHEEGGEPMNLPEGTRIVSDHLKFNKAQVKAISDELGIKVSVSDTYAKGMDKIYKSIGLKDLIEEQEEVIEAIRKLKEKDGVEGKEEATHNINLEFLSSKLKDLEEEKKPLQAKGAAMFDKVYDIQESSKPKENTTSEFKIGGKVFSKEDIFRIAEEKGIDKDRALEIIAKFHDGGEAHNKQYGVGHADSVHDSIDPTFTPGTSKNIEDPNLPSQPFTEKALGLAGTVNKENYVASMSELKTQFPELYNGVYEEVKDAEGNIINITLKKGKSHKDFQEGVNSTYDKLITDIKSRIKDPAKQKEAITMVEKEKFNESDRYKKLDSLMGNFTASRRNFKLEDVEAAVEKGAEVITPEAVTTTGVTPAVQTEEQKARAKGIYLLPDQSPLPPSPYQPSLKAERRYGRIDPSLMTPDTQLTEIKRSAADAEQQIATLPSGQREAALMGLQANVQAQEESVINKVELFNKQAIQQANAINLRQGDREEDARVADLMSYEQRSLGALANTEDDYRRYWNEGQKRNVENFKTIENLNLMNALYENFDVTNDGIVVSGDSGITPEGELNKIKSRQAMAAGTPPVTTTTTKKKEDPNLVKQETGGMYVKKFKRKIR